MGSLVIKYQDKKLQLKNRAKNKYGSNEEAYTFGEYINITYYKLSKEVHKLCRYEERNKIEKKTY